MKVKTSIILSGDLPHTKDELIEQLSEHYRSAALAATKNIVNFKLKIFNLKFTIISAIVIVFPE
jgi:GTP:adenosylcobinamide-phosphate guanylyltransferase